MANQIKLCGGLNENGPLGSYIFLLIPQLVNCLERIKMCGLVGEGASLGMGFEVSKVHARSRLCLCLPAAYGENVKLSVTVPAPF